MTDEVGTISEETASSAENVAAAAEEQTATINEVTSGIESLSDQAGDLSELLQTFDVDRGPLTAVARLRDGRARVPRVDYVRLKPLFSPAPVRF